MVALNPIETGTAEFSRRVAVDSAEVDGTRVEFEATAEECQALARRFDLEALTRLDGSARLQVTDAGRIRAEVTFHGDVLQLCVVTLEPVATTFSETFSVDFAATTDATEDVEEIVFDISDEDPPEALIDGHFDLGEVVAQHLATLIDPYPRAADAVVEVTEAGQDEDESPERVHPFAALERLRTKD